MNKWIKWFLPSLLIGAMVSAGTIKSWSTGEALTAADLNSNFSHIHSLMVGGHGARLVNSDVSASAAIASSKLASYRFIPRTWVTVLDGDKACGAAGTACTEYTAGSTSVVGNGTAGWYTVTLGYTATNANYAVSVSPMGSGSGTDGACMVTNLTTTTFVVECSDLATPTALAIGFTAVVYDND